MYLHALAEVLLITGTLLLIVSFIFKRYPPAKINALYGYRTKRSMQSADAWDFAQRRSARSMIKLSLLMIGAGIVSLFISIEQYPPWMPVVVLLVILFVGFAWLFYRTERALHKRF